MRVIDAFAGIGGFSLAADALGWETVAFVERDPDCQFWLGQHWPGVPIYGDICAVRWEDAPPCDVFTAGFPCQPHSVAGKRKASADDRDLWSECVRAIGVLRPRYAVLENVPGLLTSESGRFFNRVLSDLAALGYVGRYDVLSAAECGAPHKRERVWIVAHPEGERVHGRAEQAGRCRSDRHRHGVGDTPSQRGQGEPHAPRRRHQGNARVDNHPGHVIHAPWADAIPYRGADGTVRFIPAGAVEHAEVCIRRSFSGEGGRVSPEGEGEARSRGIREGERGSIAVGHEYAGRGNGRGQEEVSRAEPALRALDHGISDGLAGRHAAEEVEAWPTVTVADGGLSDGTPRPSREATGRTTEYLARTVAQYGGAGGSLWPVTDSEPGRVARLRAVGNAVVPAWVLAGPFRYILDLEASR